MSTCRQLTVRGELTITLGAIFLKPTNDAKEVTFFALGVIDSMLERVDFC